MANMSYGRTIVGYHGCDARLATNVIAGRARLHPSLNAYDWLGRGIYFWEHGPRRAYEWAIEQARLSGAKIKEPAVLGAKINLGVCLDLLDTANTRLLRSRYFQFRQRIRRRQLRMPKNQPAPDSWRADKVLRFRDCAIIDFTLDRINEVEGVRY